MNTSNDSLTKIEKLPLYEIFETLRKQKFSLGIAEYYALIETLQGGFGLDKATGQWDRQKIYDTCQLLWLKPNQNIFLFKTIFESYFPKIGEQSLNMDNQIGVQGLKEVKESIDNELENEQVDDATKEDKPDNDKEDKLQKIYTEYIERFVKLVLGNSTGKKNYLSVSKTSPSRQFLFSDAYFGITFREMQQTFRFLPQYVFQQDSNQVDILTSVNKIAQMGIMIKPIFMPLQTINNEVFLLTDHEGSMIAFEKLTNLVEQALILVFSSNRSTRCFFQNVPQEQLYKNAIHTDCIDLQTWMEQLHPIKSNIIIISDAGAARGTYSSNRVSATIKFLFNLRQYTQKIVWLNPFPEKRWKNTAAERIAQFVPMYGMNSQQQLQYAINQLRGKL